MKKINSTILLLLISTISISQTPDATWTNYFKRTSGWSAGDATISIPRTSWNGAVTHNIWLHGDSHLGNVDSQGLIPCIFDIKNAIVRQTGSSGTFTTITSSGSGFARTPVKFPENGQEAYNNCRLWPHHGYEHNNTINAFFGAYADNWTYQGLYLAQFNYNISSSSPSSINVTKVTGKNSGPNGIQWGMWTIVSGNEVYVYGTKKNGATYDLFVAWANINNILGDWLYWTGNSWSWSPTAAGSIASGLSGHVSVVKFKDNGNQDRYFLINQEQNVFYACGDGRNIYSYEGNIYGGVVGPFTNPKTIYTVTDKLLGTGSNNYMITYDAQAHPQFTNSDGLLISYNVNGNCTECQSDPFSQRKFAYGYRPKFIRVPLSVIHPSLSSVSSSWRVGEEAGDELKEDELKVYPNPAKGKLHVQLSNYNSETCSEVVISNTSGQIILKKQLEGRETEIDVSGSGLHFVQIVQDNESKIYKVWFQE